MPTISDEPLVAGPLGSWAGALVSATGAAAAVVVLAVVVVDVVLVAVVVDELLSSPPQEARVKTEKAARSIMSIAMDFFICHLLV